jgi:hypothetical protein
MWGDGWLKVGDFIYARIYANGGVGTLIYALRAMAIDWPAGSFADENI